MSVDSLVEKKDRPSFVRFERRAVEDKAATLQAGHYVAKDVDYVLITAPYSRDVFHSKVTTWLAELEAQKQAGRIDPDWVTAYKKQYKAFQDGEELPLVGTPIKGWGVISPAQQKTLIEMHVLTVEDLAVMNDEGIKRIGMGGVDLKIKAKGWLAQLSDKGPLTVEIASVRKENENLKTDLHTLREQVERLTALASKEKPQLTVVTNESSDISASDIIGDPVTLYTEKFGKPPHHRMKPESILAALEG